MDAESMIPWKRRRLDERLGGSPREGPLRSDSSGSSDEDENRPPPSRWFQGSPTNQPSRTRCKKRKCSPQDTGRRSRLDSQDDGRLFRRLRDFSPTPGRTRRIMRDGDIARKVLTELQDGTLPGPSFERQEQESSGSPEQEDATEEFMEDESAEQVESRDEEKESQEKEEQQDKGTCTRRHDKNMRVHWADDIPPSQSNNDAPDSGLSKAIGNITMHDNDDDDDDDDAATDKVQRRDAGGVLPSSQNFFSTVFRGRCVEMFGDRPASEEEYRRLGWKIPPPLCLWEAVNLIATPGKRTLREMFGPRCVERHTSTEQQMGKSTPQATSRRPTKTNMIGRQRGRVRYRTYRRRTNTSPQACVYCSKCQRVVAGYHSHKDDEEVPDKREVARKLLNERIEKKWERTALQRNELRANVIQFLEQAANIDAAKLFSMPKREVLFKICSFHGYNTLWHEAQVEDVVDEWTSFKRSVVSNQQEETASESFWDGTEAVEEEEEEEDEEKSRERNEEDDDTNLQMMLDREVALTLMAEECEHAEISRFGGPPDAEIVGEGQKSDTQTDEVNTSRVRRDIVLDSMEIKQAGEAAQFKSSGTDDDDVDDEEDAYSPVGCTKNSQRGSEYDVREMEECKEDVPRPENLPRREEGSELNLECIKAFWRALNAEVGSAPPNSPESVKQETTPPDTKTLKYRCLSCNKRYTAPRHLLDHYNVQWCGERFEQVLEPDHQVVESASHLEEMG